LSSSEQHPAENSAISRRGFARWLGFGSALAALGAFAIYWRERKTSYPVKVVAHEGEIPVGGSKVFAYPEDDRPCFLLRPAQDAYLAFSRLCTHHTCPVFYRPEQNVFACPCHGGIFSATTGNVLDGPPPKPLPEVILERRGDEILATGFVKTA
jgi:Rieske Fe-S protein